MGACQGGGGGGEGTDRPTHRQTDRPTDRQTDQQTDIVVYREVTLPIIRSCHNRKCDSKTQRKDIHLG